MVTYYVLGYCRSTVGGFDVWANDHILFSETNVLDTTINKMNYNALNLLLTFLCEFPPNTIDQDINIQCGCFMVWQQINRHMVSNSLKVEYTKSNELLLELKTKNPATLVDIYYNNQLRPPITNNRI